MAVTIKSKKEIELMREAGKMLEEVHNKLADFVKPGISTLEIDQFGEKAIRDLGCVPNFLNYNGYPASICVSVNDEVVHGIPSKDRILQDGDIVSLDAGLIHEGYHSDAARTHAVGNISEEAKRLIGSHREALDKIAAYLIRRETITGKEFMKIFREVKGIPDSETEQAEANVSNPAKNDSQPDGQDEPALIEEKTDNGASSESDINVSLETKAED